MEPDIQQQQQQQEQGMLLTALAADVQKISSIMKEFDTLEEMLQNETTKGSNEDTDSSSSSSSNVTSGRVIEIKTSMKKLMTNPETMEVLDRLEVQGEPIWGLSRNERELIILAREKVNEC